jgi:hypothetical protein
MAAAGQSEESTVESFRAAPTIRDMAAKVARLAFVKRMLVCDFPEESARGISYW